MTKTRELAAGGASVRPPLLKAWCCRWVIPFGGAWALAVALAGGCAGSPWFLGRALDGKPVIPASSRAETVANHRRKLIEATRRGDKVIEIAQLFALEERGALHAPERKRFVELLRERARDWAALRRPVPLAEDLRHIIALEPARARPFTPALRSATRAAGDFWLAIGENARAEEEYRRAELMGADRMVFRLRAAWGASPADLDQAVLERALSDLPPRVLAPFTAAYLEGGGGEPRVLRRSWSAARVYGPPALRSRLEALPVAATFTTPDPAVETPALATAQVESPAQLRRPKSDETLYQGATLARVLVPLARAFPELTEPGPRSRDWADRLVAEDPTSADSLEVAALIDARAGRVDGAARKLGDLVFYSPDRAGGYARAARVWEQSGQDRRGCLAWKRAAHFGAVDDPRWCDLMTCVRRTQGAADIAAVELYVRERAPTLACHVGAGADAALAPGAPPAREQQPQQQPQPGPPQHPQLQPQQQSGDEAGGGAAPEARSAGPASNAVPPRRLP